MQSKIKTILKSVFLLAIFSVAIHAFAVWTMPTDTPPGDNTPAPVNTGGALQHKPGSLLVNLFRVFGDAYFDGNVGVGTVTPFRKLDVNGSGVRFSNSGNGIEFLQSNGTNWQIANIGTNNSLSVNGNLGVGTTAPATKLDVAGTIKSTGFQLTTGAGANKILQSDASGLATWVNPPTGSGLPTGTNGQTVRNNNGTWEATSSIFNNGTNVGIGTTNPSAKLHVAGGGITFYGELRPNDSAGLAGQYLKTNGSGIPYWADIPTVQGPPGPSGTVSVGNTTTGAPGTNASVTDSDPSPSVAVLQFTIPQGLPGNDGQDGPPGIQGVKGDKGDKGDQGEQGPPGSGGVNGTINRVAKFTTTTTVGDSQIFDNGTAVGIDTTTPSTNRLTVGDTGDTNRGITFYGELRPNDSAGLSGQFLKTNGSGIPYWANPSVAFSGLTPATATNTINNTSYLQEWKWDTLGTGTALRLSSAQNNPGSGSNLFEVMMTGTNTSGITTGAYFKNLKTGGATNIGAQFWASGGANNYAILVPSGQGRVGIGTSAPTVDLDVAGTIKANTYCIATDCISAWPSGGSGLPSGTTGQTLRHNGADWIASSLLYNNASNIGINTSSPVSKLTVNQSTNADPTNPNTYAIAAQNNNTTEVSIGSAASTAYLQSWNAKPLHINGQGNNTIINPVGGNVGIGNTVPQTKLDVKGTIGISGTTSGYVGIDVPTLVSVPYTITLPNVGPSANQILQSNASGDLSWIPTPSGGGNTAINDLADATGSGTVALGNNNQTWTWATLGNNDALTLNSSGGVPSGGSQKTLEITTSGANGAAGLFSYGLHVSNTHTGNGANVGGYFSATGGSTNVAIYVPSSSGGVGLGTSAPSSMLHLVGAFTVDEMGAPGLSASNQGRIYFDSTANKFKVSENGGAYVDLVGGGGGGGDMYLANVQTVTGAKTFNTGTLLLDGATSGVATLNAPAVAGTAVITLPGVTGTLATLTGTETFTNKTLTSPTITTPAINVGSDVAYDMYYRNASGMFARIPNGTNGQVLTATAGAAPSWATAGGGGGGWTDGTGEIYTSVNADKVGVGTGTPVDNLFTVDQQAHTTSTTANTYGIMLQSLGVNALSLGADATSAYLQPWAKNLRINSVVGGSQTYDTTINQGGGELGVGISTPTSGSLLDVGMQGGYRGNGTVQMTNNDPNIIGTGTQFTKMFTTSDTININGLGVRTILSITDDQHLALGTAYTSGGGSSLPYTNGSTVNRFIVLGNGNVGVGTITPTEKLDINSNNIRIRTAKTPAQGSTCDTGEISWDANYMYVCTSTNTWKRASLTTY